MRIRTFGRTLGLGAIMLSAVLLIVALVGGITTDAGEGGLAAAQASAVERPSGHAEYTAIDTAGLPGAR